ncbi:nose resistant to fluoxetine protein 6 isoform X1 [Drosophila gunungcola]|uniref:nose resistant to fluoxetine protein 6 isoform X1 n=1 Tax=Drosophila gunungcola TaxID=103775 RepID=UPI0022DFD8E0|nr:nose resistant to fluoxetine protein 6 isoform X1 [Drosophila gunungcola]
MLRWLQIGILLPLFSLGRGNFSSGSFNLTLYRQMPPLHQLDDYDLCLDRPSGSYCLAYVEILPNASSTLWHLIHEVSQDSKHRFRHDRVFRGVCLEGCKKRLIDLSESREHEEGTFLDQELIAYYAKVHRRASDADERLLYEELVNSCLNLKFGEEFSLQTRSLIEYCDTADDHLEHDGLDLIFYALLICILLLTLCSSIYDFRLSQINPQQTENFYRKAPSSRRQQLLTSFSMVRNFYRLIEPPVTDLSRDVSFFDGFRVIGVFVVILGHTLMVFMTIPIQNPEFYEQFLFRFETSVFQNGSLVIQVFFVMSGFLLYVNFTERQLVNPKTGNIDCITVYFRVFFYRYFRLLPSLGALILFNGTLLVRLQNGPFWRHLTEAERVFCRSNWWKNVFFVTNHMLEDSCSHQTWYLGADMQLFELFLIVIVISKKHPNLTRPLYITLSILALAVPAILTYVLELDAVYHLRPETYRYLYFRHSDTFYQMYPPFYTNLGGYLLGFLCGHLYLKKRPQGLVFRGNLKFELAMWLLVLATLGLLFSGYIFIRQDFAKPSLWLALYAGVHKNLWLLICAGFVFLMCCKVGGMAYDFCTLPLFRPLARISFQSFLWHVVILRIVAGCFRQPVYVSSFYLMCNVLSVFIITQVVAAFVAIVLELPLGEVLRCLMKPETGREEPNPVIQTSRAQSAV